jgi:DNA repair protein RadA/Sms
MARNKTRFVCQACGAVRPKWQSRCDAFRECTLAEAARAARRLGPAASADGGSKASH